MALRRQRPLCLLCQCRQSSIGRRRALSTSTKLLEVSTGKANHDTKFFSDNNDTLEAAKQPASTHKNLASLDPTNAPVDPNGKHDDLLSLEALTGLKDLRHRILASLRNPWPTLSPLHSRLRTSSAKKLKYGPLTELRLPEANAALIPHATFRDLVLKTGIVGKPLRRIIRAQLLRVQWPREIYRIVAVCMSLKESAQSLAVLSQSMARALYRCRVNVSDPEVLRTIGVIIARFKMAGLPVSSMYLGLGLRFAARSRNLDSMKKYLRLFRESGETMNVHAFRSVIAKFSIGTRGLGEIRNGRWKRNDLLQVLKGFEDCKHLPREQQYHLGAFLDRTDWQYLHGWIAVLARCRDADAVWHEWELWKQSPGRLAPRQLGGCTEAVTTKFRGDYWFLDHMTYTGDLDRAWKIFEESDMNFRTIRSPLKFRLLERPELASQESWENGMREALVEKYDYELLKIEKAFGIRWKVDENDSEAYSGTHELVEDQWETLEKLGADDWKLETDFGFPYETKEGDVLLVPDRKDRELHQAEERELFVYDRKSEPSAIVRWKNS